MTALGTALQSSRPRLVATSQLAIMALDALRATGGNVDKATAKLCSTLREREPLTAELVGPTVIYRESRIIVERYARDMAGDEMEGVAHGVHGSDAQPNVGHPSAPSEPAHPDRGSDAHGPGGRALMPVGDGAQATAGDLAQTPIGLIANTTRVREHERRLPSRSDGGAQIGAGDSAQGTDGSLARPQPKPSRRTLQSLASTATTSRKGLLYTFTLRDGRAIGEVRWCELGDVAESGEREARLARRLMEHATVTDPDATVADVVNEMTLARIIEEANRAG